MPDCKTIDPFVTPYVDGQISEADRRAVDEHLRVCPPCDSRVHAERAVRDLLHTRKPALTSPCAPDALHARCAAFARRAPDARLHSDDRLKPRPWTTARDVSRPITWRSRLAPLALAASLVLIVGAAFLYQLTASSSRVLAAELAADHVKCFALNGVLRTHDEPAAVESSMLSGFGWQMRLPLAANELELVGARPCLYGEGKIAHIMYRHRGEPMSLFMLPKAIRRQELVQVLGHKAAIWCVGDRTFVLVTREPRSEVDRLTSTLQAQLR